jgi:hypothetical protein
LGNPGIRKKQRKSEFAKGNPSYWLSEIMKIVGYSRNKKNAEK